MRTRRAGCYAFLTFLLLLFAGSQAFAEDVIKIGWIGPLTGPAAVLGADGLPAAKLACDEINARGGVHGAKLEIVAEDDQYSSPLTVTAYQKLVQVHGVKVILVVTYSGLFAIAPLAEKDRVVLIDPLDCDQAIGALPRHTLCVAKTSEDLGVALADEIIRKRDTPTAVLYYDGDAFMGTVARALEARMKDRAGQAPLMATYGKSTTNFKPQLLRMKESNAKGVALLGYDELGTGFKQVKELQISAQLYGLSTILSQAGKDLAGDSMEGAKAALWLAPASPQLQSFYAAFERSTGRKPLPDVFVAPPYDIAHLIAHILENGGYNAGEKTVDAERLLNLLYSTKDFEGVSGAFSIQANGMATGFTNIAIRTVRSGRLVSEQ